MLCAPINMFYDMLSKVSFGACSCVSIHERETEVKATDKRPEMESVGWRREGEGDVVGRGGGLIVLE